ncbi:hypothetical protein, partial [Pseudovibrio exalbescens]|uniref:hypothetical protein n=1 Tax=Pseudovibrio exalbescens TaxID=197461 RepID=UPI001AD949BC
MTWVVVVVVAYSFTEGTAPGRQAGTCLPIQLYWSQFTLRDRFTCPICAYFQSERALPILLGPSQNAGPSLFIRFAHLTRPLFLLSFVIPRLTRDPVGWWPGSPGLVALDAGSA